MASDKNPKDKSRKRHTHTDSEDEGKARKKHRSRDEDGGGSKKSKSHKNSERRSRKEKKHKSEDSKHDGHSNFTEISTDDYFSKNNEFATWLKEEKKKFFSDLSTESARELFTEFTEEWNTHKLKSKFYKGIKTGPRSSHKWKIAK